MRAINLDRGTELARRVESAHTFRTRLQGLRDRPGLVAGEALWIVPSRGVHTWGMSFPIDVVYLDGGMTVVTLLHNLPPRRLGPLRRHARTVLELPAGTIERTGTRLGDRIRMQPRED